MARVRVNFLKGLITAVDESATTLTSAQFKLLPDVSTPDYIPIVLDPELVTETVKPEICYIILHEANSTTAEVIRGAEGTLARSHGMNTFWLCGPLAEDFRHNNLTGRSEIESHPATAISFASSGIISAGNVQSAIVETVEKATNRINHTGSQPASTISDFNQAVLQRIARVHVQNQTSNTWVIIHDLGYYPSITVVDSGGTVVVGQVDYNSINQATVSFSSSFSGRAYLS
jgi:hypothetical protein